MKNKISVGELLSMNDKQFMHNRKNTDYDKCISSYALGLCIDRIHTILLHSPRKKKKAYKKAFKARCIKAASLIPAFT